MRFWFITGIPGTGKTTIGNHLADKYGFVHLDVEEELGKPNAWEKIQQIILDAKNNEKDLVITWGFQPANNNPEVSAIRAFGAKLVWFDGNREAARKSFIKRGDVSIELLDIQMANINSVNIASVYNPIFFNTFNREGEFLEKDEIVRLLNELD